MYPPKASIHEDVEGYYFTGQDGSQIAYWTSHKDRTSKPHRHEFDEYVVCIQGQYTVIIGGVETVLKPGDEFFIPKGTPKRDDASLAQEQYTHSTANASKRAIESWWHVADFIKGRVPKRIGAKHYMVLRRQSDKFYGKYAEYLTKLRAKV